MGLGPPGAGKTTLVASYLAARRLGALRYQLDAGDADPATLFYYLRLAATGRRSRRGPEAPGHNRSLPLLAPEYLPDLATFTRRFFEELYRRLPRPGLLVFDDHHELPADSAVHAVVRDGLAGLPAGCGAVIVSRGEPPPAPAPGRHGLPETGAGPARDPVSGPALAGDGRAARGDRPSDARGWFRLCGNGPH